MNVLRDDMTWNTIQCDEGSAIYPLAEGDIDAVHGGFFWGLLLRPVVKKAIKWGGGAFAGGFLAKAGSNTADSMMRR